MMNSSINAIQGQYPYAIESVRFFEAKQSKNVQTRKDPFDFINQMSQKGFNPFHPNVKSPTMARNLDIIS